MKREEEPMDLLTEARRRPLSRDEEARLEELVERSPEARILHYAGWTFDRDSSAREGDDVLVARLASRAAERMANLEAPLPPRRRRRPFVTLLAAALAVAGTAGAGVGVAYLVKTPERAAEVSVVSNAPVASPKSPSTLRAGSPTTPPTSAPEVVPSPAPTSTIVVMPVPDGAVEPAVAARAPVAEAVPAPKRASASGSEAPVAARDVLGAPALFGQANQLRLAGDTRGAIVVYKLLTEHHPGSAEADLAELSLGKLLLASGDASGALTHFRRAAASGGALGAEALWGEASALKALGRSGEERRTLERLLALHPDGAYAKAARKRLGTDAP